MLSGMLILNLLSYFITQIQNTSVLHLFTFSSLRKTNHKNSTFGINHHESQGTTNQKNYIANLKKII